MSETIFAPDAARLQLELDEARSLLGVWQRAWAAAADAAEARRGQENLTAAALANLLDSIGIYEVVLDDGIVQVTVSAEALSAALLAGTGL